MNEGKGYKCLAHYIFCICILLYYVEWLVSGIQKVDTAAVAHGSDEHKALEQALFLVELLKSEYPRALRENNEMQENSELLQENSMTCATTSRNLKEESQQDHATPIYARSFPRKPIYIPDRRHYYNVDYGDGDKVGGIRRFYDDVFGPQPGNANTRPTNSTTPIIVDASSTINMQSTTSTPTTKSNGNNNIFSETSSSSVVTIPTTATIYDTTTKPSFETLTTKINTPETVTNHPTSLKNAVLIKKLSFSKKVPGTTAIVLTSHTVERNVSHTISSLETPIENIATKTETSKQKLIKTSTLKSSTIELELSQAAAELENEFDGNFANGLKVLKHDQQKSVSWRGSTRIHLAGSTRYPIPLPENHAFCYTNPKSALCRTFI